MSKQQEKRLNIINKTITLCAQNGFHGTSIDSITTATGVSKATIYKYFISKENLIKEALSLFSEFNHTDDNIADICSGYKKTRVNMIHILLNKHDINNSELKSQQAELIFNGLLATLQVTENIKLIPMAKNMYLNVIFANNKDY